MVLKYIELGRSYEMSERHTTTANVQNMKTVLHIKQDSPILETRTDEERGSKQKTMAVSYMALHENHIFKCLILYIIKDLD